MQNENLKESSLQQCKSCAMLVATNYCGNCGESVVVKRISLHGLIHDAIHLFTHVEKGLLYTLKQLLINPGQMQRTYVEGARTKFQKPFSVFFICATFAGLGKYWIAKVLVYYQMVGEVSDADFHHKYMVLEQIAFLPISTLLTYVFFRKSKYNYAETGVMMLYTTGMFLVFSTFISALKFIWHELDGSYIEVPVLIIYNSFTFINFYQPQKKWVIVIKSIGIFLLMFLMIKTFEEFMLLKMK